MYIKESGLLPSILHFWLLLAGVGAEI